MDAFTGKALSARLSAALSAALLAAAALGCAGGLLDSGQPELGVANPGQPRDNTPHVLAHETPGVAVAGDGSALIDYSHVEQGYIAAQALADGKYKVLVTDEAGTRYQYTISQPGAYAFIPITSGSGRYLVSFNRNVEDDAYGLLFSLDLDVELADELLPFLYPNQYVDFAADDEAVRLSEEVTTGATSEIEALDAIYLWCVMNLSYDHHKADTVQPGYLPNNADTLASRTGICFDYAVLCASMMRAQGLPTRLEIGYLGSTRHAWVSVYTREHGVIRYDITFDPDTWRLLDPTLDSAQRTPLGLAPILTDPDDYQPLLYY